ncbi:hypothetical protein BD310DRAFT_6847 [Dichomitus squalens]|uniref:Uncharacterized protein n=1 Tax=Dichomitus squalens TaxID=114155 RepID=A0A4Q9QDH8_9APHY|nr:hypothetical protein BD310DRAFT_6847 [Dichomitus squalens]
MAWTGRRSGGAGHGSEYCRSGSTFSSSYATFNIFLQQTFSRAGHHCESTALLSNEPSILGRCCMMRDSMRVPPP